VTLCCAISLLGIGLALAFLVAFGTEKCGASDTISNCPLVNDYAFGWRLAALALPSRVIPVRAARLGPDGPPLRLTVTIYGRHEAIWSASTTLSSIRQPPGSPCELRGYTILAQMAPGGALGCYPVA
jgi:hypothetical protein